MLWIVAGVPAIAGTKREGRENRPRTRRCDRRRMLRDATVPMRVGMGRRSMRMRPFARS